MVFDVNYTIPKMIKDSAEKWPELPAQYARVKGGDFQPIIYRDMFQYALDFGAGLLNLGIKRGELIGLISDNRPEWLYADVGLMSIGCTDVPRGCDATINDLEKIFSLTEIQTVITENSAQVNKIVSLKEKVPSIKQIIVFENEIKPEVKELAEKNQIKIIFYSDLMKDGQKWRIEHKGEVEAELEKGTQNDLATIIFTSGTTGTPKGVQLTHGGFLAQLDEIPERIYLNPGDRALSVLPVWHVFEREVEYVILIQGASLCYSKPVGSILLADFKAINPQFLVFLKQYMTE